MINPRTYAYLGERDVAYRAHRMAENSEDPSGPDIHIKKGQILGESAVLESGIVARAGQVP